MGKMAEDKTTERLEATLKKVRTEEEMKQYIMENTKGTYRNFKEFFDAYISMKDISLKHIKEKSGINPNYFYNVINADRNPGRDKVLALCVAAGMSYDETKKALRLANVGDLNPKDARDALIAVAINTRLGDVTLLNIKLDENGQEILK